MARHFMQHNLGSSKRLQGEARDVILASEFGRQWQSSGRGLWTLDNYKLQKGAAFGYAPIVMHLSPATKAGVSKNGALQSVCPFATFGPAGCATWCLDSSGRNRADSYIRRARDWRTRWFFSDRAGFIEALAWELDRWRAFAHRNQLKLCARPNGTSDLPILAEHLTWRFEDVQFYDYTKIPHPERRERKNYRLTFSYSGENLVECLRLLSTDVNIAVVFDVKRGDVLPPSFSGRRVVDGDNDDLRFLDPPGVIVGLRTKAPGGNETRVVGEFIVPPEYGLRVAA